MKIKLKAADMQKHPMTGSTMKKRWQCGIKKTKTRKHKVIKTSFYPDTKRICS